MNDLIDRRVANEYFDLYRHSILSTDEITSMIPTAVLNVVRCKDCKHWHREIHNDIEYFNYNSCDLNHGGDGYDFYCAEGEQK